MSYRVPFVRKEDSRILRIEIARLIAVHNLRKKCRNIHKVVSEHRSNRVGPHSGKNRSRERIVLIGEMALFVYDAEISLERYAFGNLRIEIVSPRNALIHRALDYTVLSRVCKA